MGAKTLRVHGTRLSKYLVRKAGDNDVVVVVWDYLHALLQLGEQHVVAPRPTRSALASASIVSRR